MKLAETKNWMLEQGTTGNYLMVYSMKGDGCSIICHHAKYRTIDCNDDLTKLPNTIKTAIRKWCEDKAEELLAVNKVDVGVVGQMINEIKQALVDATQGKWIVRWDTPFLATVRSEDAEEWNGVATRIEHNDAHLIAHSPEWLRYLIGEVERLSKCQSCGGRGYVELSHDPYMTSPCECVIFEQAVEEYPKIKLRNAELEKVLKQVQSMQSTPSFVSEMIDQVLLSN